MFQRMGRPRVDSNSIPALQRLALRNSIKVRQTWPKANSCIFHPVQCKPLSVCTHMIALCPYLVENTPPHPSFPLSRESILRTFVVQVGPIWISLLNQFNLPRSVPLLEGFLPRDSALHSLVYLIPDQLVNTITLCETFYQVILVLPDSLGEIGCYANVERAIGLVCKYVNTR